MRSLHDSWELGGVTIPNRVVLAPLAGIGNWFVRLQAKRYGAGPRGLRDGVLVRDPLRQPQDARRAADASTRASARAGRWRSSCSGRTRRSCARPPRTWRAIGADLIDLNMGCPVPKVMKTGAGAALAVGSGSRPWRWRSPLREGSGLAGDREAARRGSGGGSAARVGGGRGRDHLPSAHDQGAAQGHAGLRPRGLARGVAARAGDRDRRHGRSRSRALGVRVHRLRGGDAGARARSAIRGCSSRCSGARDIGSVVRRDPGGMGAGCSTAPRSIWAPIAPPATCGSSIRGTRSGSMRRTPCRTPCSALRRLTSSAAIIAEFGATMLRRAAV